MNIFDSISLRNSASVIDAGSFTRAARRLDLTPPAFGGHLCRLAVRGGGPLPWRTLRVLGTTAESKRPAGHAGAILSLTCAASETLSRSFVQGRLHLGIAEGCLTPHFPRVLRDFVPENPSVDIGILERLTGDEWSELTCLRKFKRGAPCAHASRPDHARIDGSGFGAWAA